MSQNTLPFATRLFIFGHLNEIKALSKGMFQVILTLPSVTSDSNFTYPLGGQKKGKAQSHCDSVKLHVHIFQKDQHFFLFGLAFRAKETKVTLRNYPKNHSLRPNLHTICPELYA